jgi:hypothetical protein
MDFLLSVTGNYQLHKRYGLPPPVTATNDDPSAAIYEVRAHASFGKTREKE